MMIRSILKKMKHNFSMKDDIKKRMAEFISVDTGGVLRNSPTTKERKYKNVEIAEDFKKIDERRKKQRLQNIRRREILLENKMKNEGKLLSHSQTQLINEELKEVKNLIKQFEQQINYLTTEIDQNEAQYVLIEGYKKMTVLNHIKYLHYVHSHNPGYTLHPETIKAIENIHYCVNHNLPVNRITLYEVMPEYFQTEIGELEESIQKLIAQKNISIEDEDATSSIRFFNRQKMRQNQLTGPALIKEEVQRSFQNVYDYSVEILSKHHDYIKKVQEGKTPFRNVEHMYYVMLSNLKINYLPEEQALRKDIFEVVVLKQEWEAYKKESLELLLDMKHNYVQPPPYIANHPVLMDKWQRIMTKFTNPVSQQSQGMLPEGDMTEVVLGQNMRRELEQIVSQKYDPLFVEAMNGDRSQIDKKKLQIQFYNLSTDVYEKLNALEDKSNPQEQIFKKLPKTEKKFLTQQRKKPLIKMEHLTRMIFLNNKNKHKYNLEFFSQWFGIQSNELRTLLKTVSYLRVPPQKQKKTEQEIEYHIIRFQM